MFVTYKLARINASFKNYVAVYKGYKPYEPKIFYGSRLRKISLSISLVLILFVYYFLASLLGIGLYLEDMRNTEDIVYINTFILLLLTALLYMPTPPYEPVEIDRINRDSLKSINAVDIYYSVLKITLVLLFLVLTYIAYKELLLTTTLPLLILIVIIFLYVLTSELLNIINLMRNKKVYYSPLWNYNVIRYGYLILPIMVIGLRLVSLYKIIPIILLLVFAYSIVFRPKVKNDVVRELLGKLNVKEIGRRKLRLSPGGPLRNVLYRTYILISYVTMLFIIPISVSIAIYNYERYVTDELAQRIIALYNSTFGVLAAVSILFLLLAIIAFILKDETYVEDEIIEILSRRGYSG